MMNRRMSRHSRILFIEGSTDVCPFQSLVDHFYLAKALIKEKRKKKELLWL